MCKPTYFDMLLVLLFFGKKKQRDVTNDKSPRADGREPGGRLA